MCGDDAFFHGEYGGDDCDGVRNHDGRDDERNRDGGGNRGRDGGARDVSGGDGRENGESDENDDCDGGDKDLISSSHLGWRWCFRRPWLSGRTGLRRLDLFVLRSFHRSLVFQERCLG